MIKIRKIFFIISGILVLASIISLAIFSLNLGIDFTGGSLLEVKFVGQENSVPYAPEIQEKLEEFAGRESIDLGKVMVQATGENGLLLRMREINEQTHQKILQELQSLSESAFSVDSSAEEIDRQTIEEQRFESIGPVIGSELKRKAVISIIIVLIAIILYIAWAFRKVSKPVASWKYGLAAIVALSHDVLIILGVFAILGRFLNVKIDIAFVAALLTILGYSVNDTIVVFDRTRENLKSSLSEEFPQVVDRSVKQTITRSINTSLTTLFVLIAILIFGGASIRWFIAALSLGVIIGTYSSIFIASPMLVEFERLKK